MRLAANRALNIDLMYRLVCSLFQKQSLQTDNNIIGGDLEKGGDLDTHQFRRCSPDEWMSNDTVVSASSEQHVKALIFIRTYLYFAATHVRQPSRPGIPSPNPTVRITGTRRCQGGTAAPQELLALSSLNATALV